jgi:hypothetical protein
MDTMGPAISGKQKRSERQQTPEGLEKTAPVQDD